MKTTIKNIGLLMIVALSFGFLQSCKNKDPSIAKIFVRSASNELVSGAKVILIGDVNHPTDPANPHVDTLVTNGSGFASFDLQSHFDGGGEDYTVAFFDILVDPTEPNNGSGTIRTRVATTAVETVYLN